MAEIRYLENRREVIFFCRGRSDLDKISHTGAERHVDCGDMVEIKIRSRIPIWRTFVQIQWHVISEQPTFILPVFRGKRQVRCNLQVTLRV